ncbi:membrane protein [Bradyrhizobium sp. SSBR45G]|uniref:outer membrane protein n=1 Tax=unclassified Bradyrhizobium TaxID=2631580 RepID=UPI002342B502|nr:MULTISPECIES: outer membrane protein [unclassified Bradyrhizobium]GLH75665.1 membrane protein [Bradyrhizobium sp. SSBR45G]GLH82545.1 membrane protein [Bradyrhizobium sp. SSBR45R]
MKKILLATVALAALAAPAAAADLAARPTYTKAPVAAPVPTWTGFYLGAFGGYATTENGGILSPKGGFVGGTAGYNFQSANWVYGIEVDAAWADIKDSFAFGGAAIGAKIDATGTVRGRIGYAFNNVLLYSTGGYAWADNKLTLSAAGLSASDSQLLSGWTVGAGAEFLIAPKWSLKAEYLYKSFGGKTYFNGVVPTGELNLHTVQVGVNYHF